jgi:hypothetical protein
MTGKGSVPDFRRIDRATADKRMVPGRFQSNFPGDRCQDCSVHEESQSAQDSLKRSTDSADGSQARCGVITNRTDSLHQVTVEQLLTQTTDYDGPKEILSIDEHVTPTGFFFASPSN